jgi:hypothetical protein
MPPKKGKIVDRKFFNALGKRAARKYKDHIWNDQKDVYDRKFKDYQEPYRTLKRSNKIRYQHGGSTNSKAPFLIGNFKNDFKHLGADNGGFRMGWTSWGHLVGHLREMRPNKRVVTDKNQPMPEDIQKFIMKMVKKKTERYYPKKEVIRIKIGGRK